MKLEGRGGGGGAFVVAEKQSAICKNVPAFIQCQVLLKRFKVR